MKKCLILLLLSLVLPGCLFSCTEKAPQSTASPSPVPLPSFTEEKGPRDTVLRFASSGIFYKSFGRTFVSEEGLHVNFGGNGLEFSAHLSGDVYLTYSGEVKTYFQIEVDGSAGERIVTEVGKNLKICIARGLSEGVHTIRIIRDTDATKKGELMALTGIEFFGLPESVSAPPDANLLIEFVGDSITAGKYTEMQYGQGDAIHKATNSYAYRAAAALNADFSILARGGCGFFRVSTCPRTINQLYPYENGFEANPKPYTPARRADVVVVAMGTNDSTANVTESYQQGIVPFSTFDDALKDLIGQIRATHGEDVKIVLMYNMMSSSWETQFKRVAASENTFILKVTRNREGGNNHPSTEGHRVIAEELCRYLRETVLTNP